MEKYYIKWEELEEFVDGLINYLKDKKINPSGVYGIPRGGLVIATIISNRMNIPMLLAPADNCIIVDDIADSGRTLVHFTENDTQFNRYHIMTMYYHKRSIVKPEYYMFEKGDKWLVFPWEKKD